MIYKVPLPRAERTLAELASAGVLHGDLSLTQLGEETQAKLEVERRATLGRLLDGWEPEQHEDLARLLNQLARDLATTPDRELIVAGRGQPGAT